MTRIQGVIETANIHNFEILEQSLPDELKTPPGRSKYFLGGFPLRLASSWLLFDTSLRTSGLNF